MTVVTRTSIRRSVRSRAIRVLRRTDRLDEVLELRNRYRSKREARARAVALRLARSRLTHYATADDVFVTTVPSSSRSFTGVVARRRRTSVARDAMIANRQLVLDVAKALSMPTRVVPIESSNRLRVGVRDGRREDVLAFLRTIPTAYVHFDAPSIPPRQRTRHVATTAWSRLRWLAEQAWVWRVFEYRADPSGVDAFGDVYGCEIEFWRVSEAEPGRLVPRRWNGSTPWITADEFATPKIDEQAVTVTYFNELEFPIDLVYTWVDGDDPAWQARRRATLGIIDRSTLHEEADTVARFTSRDELRYSLRSVEKFADFVNHVYLVTDDQHPTWLRTDHPGLTVVSHREIFEDHGHLPTFNSHAIESRLHHVPGLAEHYVYMNDDFFFARRVIGAKFFHASGLAKFFLSRALIPLGEPGPTFKPVDSAAMNARRIVSEEFGREPTQKFKHAPYAQLRSVHDEIERRFPVELRRTNASRVRSPSDLPVASGVHQHVAYLLGRAMPGEITSRYVDLGGWNVAGQLQSLLATRDCDTFCLNDTDSELITAERKNELVGEFLHAYFPEPSTYEITA